MADGRVTIDTALNNNGFTKGIKNLKGDLGGLKSALGSIGRLVGVAFGVTALVAFSKKAIELGSNVAEVQNVVDVAFGEMSYKIEEFSKTAIQNFGMSQLAAKKTAGTYMAMARGMGINEDAASDMAISLTGLSGDVASFFNLSQEMADTKLKSVFTGETESLKDLGVVMTQANLQAYALSEGITKNIEKMSQAELVGLRYHFVLKQLALANGDFARTSDSWANQTRILAMQWEEFMSIVGDLLIKVLKPVVKTLNEIVASMIQIASTINQVMTALFGGEQAQGGMTEEAEGTEGAIEGSVENQEDLTGAMKDTEKEQKKSLAMFDELNKLTGDSTDKEEPESAAPGKKPSVDGSSSEKVDGLAEKFKHLLDKLKQGFGEIAEFVRSIWKVFEESWNQSGQKVIDAAKAALYGIWEAAKAIAAAFLAVWTGGAGERFLQNLMTMLSGILGFVGRLAEQFKLVWDEAGQALVEAFFFALNSVLELIISIGSAFAEAWNSGVGVSILETIMSILTRISEYIGILAGKLREAWEANGNGVAIWQSILNIVLDVLDFINQLVQAQVEWAKDINYEPLISAYRRLLEAVEPFVALVLDGLAWAYENILLPLSKWYIEEAAPAAIGVLTEAIKAICRVLDAFMPLGLWLWENFLQPLAEWTGGVIVSFLEGLADVLKRFGDWISENKEAVEAFVILIGSFLTAWAAATAVSGIITGVVAGLHALAAAGGLVTIVTTAFGSAVAFLTSPITIAVAAIGALIAIIVLLAKNWDKVKEAAGAVWKTIVETWGNACAWVTEHVLNPITAAFTGAINFILGAVEGFVNFFIGGVNAIINALNTISFDVPDWVPLIGGNTFGFNIPNVPELHIPRLAQGAVIPPNQEFLAVLGDQKNGRNIEAPEAAIEAAVGRGMERYGGGRQEITIRFEGTMGQLARLMKPYIDAEGTRTGVKLVQGGF